MRISLMSFLRQPPQTPLLALLTHFTVDPYPNTPEMVQLGISVTMCAGMHRFPCGDPVWLSLHIYSGDP